MNNPYYDPSLTWGSQNIRGYGDSDIEGTDWETGGEGMQGQNFAQGITGGLSAGAANSQPLSEFEIDPYAGFKGSGQGLMSGGPIGAIIGGVTSQIGQFSNLNRNIRNIKTAVQGTSYDAYGRPVYAGDNIVGAQQNVKALGDGLNSLNKLQLDPAVNLFNAAFGTSRRMRRKRQALKAGIRNAQNQFNESEAQYRNQFNSRQDYLSRLNDNSRMYNLYRWTN